MSHGSTLDDDGLLQPISPKELVMLQESVGTLDSAVLTLISAARLAAPLRKQERMLQVADVRCIHRLVEMVCAEVHESILQSLEVNKTALLTQSVCVLGGRLRWSQHVDHLLRILQADVGGMELDRVAGLVYKLAESDHWSPVINGFSQQAGKLSWKVTPNQFVVLLRGFARLNFVPHHLLTAKCLHQIEKRVVRKLTVPRLIHCLWCLAVLNQTRHRLFKALWAALCELEEDGMELRRIQLTQMHQVGLSLRFEPQGDCAPLPHSKILERAQDLSLQLLSGAPRESSYQKSVGACLTSMGIFYEEESASKGLLLDLYLPDDHLAIEFDGPSHFTRNSLQPLGSTAFKRRLVRAMGVKLVTVTVEEWDSLAGLQEQRIFLRRAMESQLRS